MERTALLAQQSESLSPSEMIALAMLLLSRAHAEMEQHEIETGLPNKRRSARQRALKAYEC